MKPKLRQMLWKAKSTQEDLDLLYTNPPWDLGLRLAQSLNVMFSVIMYSSGMPLLAWVGLAYCVIAFWCDKAVLLYGSHVPPAYSELMIKMTVQMLPIAAF